MSSILVINAAGRETRVALIENGHIAEFYLERKKDKGIVGNIYKGRVVRVLPGMQAAFVDIGLEKAAFLYVTDVFYDPDFSRAQFELTEGEHEDAPDSVEVPEHSEEALAQTLGQDVPAEAAAAKPESTEGATVPTLEAPAANVPEQVPPTTERTIATPINFARVSQRGSRICSKWASRCWSRFRRIRSGPKAPDSPATFRFQGGIWCSCPPSTT